MGCLLYTSHMVDRDRERGVVVVGVDLYHLLETETECNLLTHRCADQALGMGRHKVDVLGRGKLCRADEVVLVFAVRVINGEDEVDVYKRQAQPLRKRAEQADCRDIFR